MGGRKEGAVRYFFRSLGPGLVTGAADDDPSGIATYSQTGAQFGFGQLWTALYQIPLLIAVQECCARIGAITGRGLASVIKDHYARPILLSVILLVVVANTINIGADIGAVAAAAQLVIPAPFWLYAMLTASLVVTLEVLITYRTYSKFLKWLALALLSYPATAFMIDQDWSAILRATLIPHVELTVSFLFIITGVFGTSISPYMFFWQASQEVEEALLSGKGRDMRRLRIDTGVGMISSEVVQWFIIITTGSVLFQHGITNIATAADAARALEPLVHSFPNSGQVARDLFAVGVIGLGLLGIPVLAGSAAYAMAEALDWKEGLSLKFTQARGFYGVIIAATAVGLALNFIGIDPFRALVFTAVFNGIAAVPLLFVIAQINASSVILGEHRGGFWSRLFLWLTVAVMSLAALALFYSLLARRT